MIKITKVRISLVGNRNVKAFADIILDDIFVVKGIKIINKEDGYLIYMPNRKRDDGRLQDVAHPISSEFREYITKSVLDAYFDALKS